MHKVFLGNQNPLYSKCPSQNTPAIKCVSVWCFLSLLKNFFPFVVEGLKAVKSSHVNPEEKVQIGSCSQWWLLRVVVCIIPEEALCATSKGWICGNARPHREIKSWHFVLPVPGSIFYENVCSLENIKVLCKILKYWLGGFFTFEILQSFFIRQILWADTISRYQSLKLECSCYTLFMLN